MKIDYQIKQINTLKKNKQSQLEAELGKVNNKIDQISQMIREQENNIRKQNIEHKSYIKEFYLNLNKLKKFNNTTIDKFHFNIEKHKQNEKTLYKKINELNVNKANLAHQAKKLQADIRQLIIKQEKYSYLVEVINNE